MEGPLGVLRPLRGLVHSFKSVDSDSTLWAQEHFSGVGGVEPPGVETDGREVMGPGVVLGSEGSDRRGTHSLCGRDGRRSPVHRP